MTLPFSTRWPSKMPKGLSNQPNQFVEKIWRSLPEDIVDQEFDKYLPKLEELGYPMANDMINITPKIHTIRKDYRFKKGDWIHPVIYNRTKRRCQFTPTFVCNSTQSIKISYDEALCDWYCIEPIIFIDGKPVLDYDTIELLAFGDGFPNVKSFLSWFDGDMEGQIIHWTNLKLAL